MHLEGRYAQWLAREERVLAFFFFAVFSVLRLPFPPFELPLFFPSHFFCFCFFVFFSCFVFFFSCCFLFFFFSFFFSFAVIGIKKKQSLRAQALYHSTQSRRLCSPSLNLLCSSIYFFLLFSYVDRLSK